jgi:hypothetical protein
MKKLVFIIPFLISISCHNETDNAVSFSPAVENSLNVDSTLRKKFSIPIEFDKFKVDTFRGRRAKVDYSSSKTARRFRSAINWSISKFGVNYAGYYNLARWGCGTNCINGAITDLRNGKVYDIPDATMAYKYRKDSRLLIVNPPDSSGYYDLCGYCDPELWLWNEVEKKFERQN